MRLTLATLVLALSASAQITSTTPSAFTGSDPTATGGKFAQRSTGPSPYPKALALNGSGAWSVGTITGSASGSVSLSASSGTAPQTIYVFFDGYTNNGFAAGSYSATIPITNTGATVNVSLTLDVIARTAPTLSSVSGSFVNCSNSNAIFFDLDTCSPIANIRPGGTYNPPSLGNTDTDSTFGATIRRISNTGEVHSYASPSPINADRTLALTLATGGVYNIRNLTTGAATYSGVSADSAGNNVWDAITASIRYYISGKTVHKHVLGGADTTHWTYPGASASLTAGGSGDTSKDNWWALLTDGTDHKACAVNLSNTSQAPCASYTFSPSMGSIDYALITKGTESDTNLRYVILFGSVYNAIFSFADADAALTFVGRMPVDPQKMWVGGPTYTTTCTDAAAAAGNCFISQHADTVEVSGHQYIVWPLQTEHPYMQQIAYMQISKGDLMATAVEAGGGMTLTMPVGGNGGIDVGCAKKSAYCVVVDYPGDGTIVAGYSVTGATNASPIVITSSPAYAGVNGDVLLINNVGGNTATNGLCTVASLSGATFACSGSSGNGSYTASTGAFTRNVTPSTGAHFFEGWVIRGLNTEIRRAVKHRSIRFTNTHNDIGYYDQPRAAIANDGSLLLFDSNFGFPDGVGVFSATTGFGASVGGGISISGGAVFGGPVVAQ